MGGNFDLSKIWERQQLTREQQEAIGIIANSIHQCLVDMAGDEPIVNLAKRKNTFKDVTMSILDFDTGDIRRKLLSETI